MLVREGSDGPVGVAGDSRDAGGVAAAITFARECGVPVRVSSDAVLRRFSPGEREDVLALVGPPVEADLDELMARRGPVWLLAGVAYPGNAGFAIRTAEVSGAAGIVLDTPLDRTGRKAALRASMRADWLFPVLWEPATVVVGAARAAGRRIVVLEDAGGVAPWDADLSCEVLVVVGGERDGVPADLLAAADVRVCVPMAGFIPSYNVQAAVAALAVELLRGGNRHADCCASSANRTPVP